MESTEFIDQGLQTTTRRGRQTAGLIDHSMFPGRYELTHATVDLDSVYNDRRDTLRDRTPDINALTESAMPRRTTDRTRINMLEYQGSRYRYDPFVDPDSNFNISHRDKDPRGALGEFNWKEYRRMAEGLIRNLDFVDGADPIQEADGVHPNTLYARIRGTQNQLKARWKNFRESYNNLSTGGVGLYGDVSDVYKSAQGDSLLINDGLENDGNELVSEQRDFVDRLSNVLHLGGALRTDNTTDHRVNISSYGKIYANLGLMPMSSQLRTIEDDTLAAPGRMRENLITKQVVHTAAAEIKKTMETMAGDATSFANSKQTQGANKRVIISDILSLMGFTEQDMDNLRQATRSIQNDVRQQALYDAGNVMDMVETLEALPEHSLRELKTMAIREQLSPQNTSRAPVETMVNPQVLQAMERAINTTRKMDVVSDDLRQQVSYEQQIIHTNPMHIARQITPQDHRAARDLSETTQRFTAGTRAKKYNALAPRHKHAAGYSTAEFFRESMLEKQRHRMEISDTDPIAALNKVSLAAAVGDNQTFNRGGSLVHHATNVKNVQHTDLVIDSMNELSNTN